MHHGAVPSLSDAVPSLIPYLPAEKRNLSLGDDPVVSIVSAFEAAVSSGQPAREHTDAMARCLIEDVRQAAQSDVVSGDDAAVAQLCLAVGPMARAHEEGDWEAVWCWAMRGLGGERQDVATFDTTGYVSLWRRAVRRDRLANDVLAAFAAIVFEVGRHAGYLRDLLTHVADSLIDLLLLQPATETRSADHPVIQAVPAALAWCAVNGRLDEAGKLSEWCETAARAHSDPTVVADLRFTAALSAPAPQRASSLTVLLHDLSDEVDSHSRLQILLGAVEHEAVTLEVALPQILELIDRVMSDAAVAWRERAFGMIGALVRRLANDGRVQAATAVLQHWHSVPEAAYPHVVLLCHRSDGTQYAWDQGSCLVSAGVDTVTLTSVTNAALGEALASTDPSSVSVGVRATGKVDRAQGKLFASHANALLNPAGCASLRNHLTDETLLTPVPGWRLPYQALLLDGFGQAPPLWTSLQRPAIDPFFDHAVLIEGDTAMSGVEADLVEHVLVGGGLKVERLSSSNATTAAFRRAYGDPEVDLLWISGHGSRNPFRPETDGVQLRAGEYITLEDVRSQPRDRDQCRLLILSSCDGAATATSGGLRRRGLAAEAASSHQAVVAHQWPVDETFAAAFAALLACGLVDTRSINKAFTFAMQAVRLPTELMTRELTTRGCDPDLAIQLRSPVGGYGENILDYGVPALYR
ncbi:CHAT domain-containing protein [Actinoplanes sp. TBRC 11911]|uniref:CHAT domain-containing protein n=1 Tax=Actinoplanes sp. TBRC 11911 TaxID=2729386 RepID=UPI00145CE9BF|nr:CHAT domain-containing protein [Actinoplanes sp. TBRC 11911]NMO57308.1 CHAT domain-containing protein [Actinoplanes sp. TBRC 11911]